MIWKLFKIEEAIVTENNETSEDAKESASDFQETHNAEDEGNAKEESPAPVVETSSEPARGLGSISIFSSYALNTWYNIYI